MPGAVTHKTLFCEKGGAPAYAELEPESDLRAQAASWERLRVKKQEETVAARMASNAFHLHLYLSCVCHRRHNSSSTCACSLIHRGKGGLSTRTATLLSLLAFVVGGRGAAPLGAPGDLEKSGAKSVRREGSVERDGVTGFGWGLESA